MTSHGSARKGVNPDPGELVEQYYARGLSNGWPVYPPSERRLAELTAACALPPDHVLGVVRERGRALTVRTVAVNAMLAGCMPDYMPVVVAAVEAMLDPDFNVAGSMISTAGTAPLVIVHGQIARRIAVASGVNLFHAGTRPNVTIGRALGLLLRNGLGGEAGIFDQSTLGHPGKYSYCIAEGETGDWPPLHAALGSAEHESAVTVFAAEAPLQVHNDFSLDAEGVLRTVASAMCIGALRGGFYVVVLCPEHRITIQQHGFTRADVQSFLAAAAHRRVGQLRDDGWIASDGTEADDARRYAVQSKEDVLLVCAGGPAGRFSAVIRSWGGMRGSRPVTRRIRD